MASWSKRRKSLYALIVGACLVLAIGLPAFFYIYKPPSCFDGVQNGSEFGVDCGGSCERLCPTSFLPPDIAWTRFEEVAPGLYNIAAYVVNPNPNARAEKVPYHMALYDDRGVLITDYAGTVTLPPHRNTLAFRGAVAVGKRIPAKALFEFTGTADWRIVHDALSPVSIASKSYTEGATGGSLKVTLHNASVEPLHRIEVYAVLYDKDGNALGFSKTILDEIPANGDAYAPFTWPRSRDGAVISIEVLPVAE